MSRSRQSPLAIFGAPVILAGLSLAGLVGALLGDGRWDLIGAGLLATTLMAIAGARLAAAKADGSGPCPSAAAGEEPRHPGTGPATVSVRDSLEGSAPYGP